MTAIVQPARERSGEIVPLTSLRGLAALYVILYHFRLDEHLRGPLAAFFRHGYMSVDLFFVLSGFVMNMTYRHMFAGKFRAKSYFVFLGRRIARIYPLYLFVTLVTIALAAGHFIDLDDGVALGTGTTVANLALVQAWGVSGSYVGPAWSISAEWAVYLLFPLLVAITAFSRRPVAIAVYLACVAALVALAVLPPEVTGAAHYVGPLDLANCLDYGPVARCVIEFTFGLLACRLYRWRRMEGPLQSNWTSVSIALVMIILLGIKGADVLIALCAPLLVIALTNDRSWVGRVLSLRPLHLLGVISYSLYLTQVLSFTVHKQLPGVLLDHGIPHAKLVTDIAQIIATLGLATLTYLFVEKPGRRVLRHLFEPGRRIAAEPRPDLAAP